MKALALAADELENAELLCPYCRLTEEEIGVDGRLITSRRPGDLPAFGRQMMKASRSRSGKAARAAAITGERRRRDAGIRQPVQWRCAWP